MKKNFLISGIGTAALMSISALGAEKSDKPNIIVIMTDDQGWGDLSCYPQDSRFPDARLRTPHIDSLAAEGVRCTQGYATCMVSAPSRAGFLTGRYQQRFGWYAFEECLAGLPADEMTLAESLKPAGYATALIGKWHVGYNMHPLKRGFDRFYGFLGGQHDFYDLRLGDPVHAFSFDYYDADVMEQDKPVETMEYLTHELTKHSLQFISDSHQDGKPFFLYLAYNSPHPPLQAPWEDLEPWAKLRGGRFNARDIVRAMMKSVDDGVGEILDLLLSLGIDENTIVVFTSDNGGADDSAEYGEQRFMAQHNGGLRARKGFFYEGGIRVPYIVRWPAKIPEGIVYNEPVSHLDIFATAVAAAGVKPPEKPLDGVDLVPYFSGEKKDRPHDVLQWGLQAEHGRWAVRDGDWKLVKEFKNDKAIKDKDYEFVLSLFNLAEDPLEENDLHEKCPDVTKRLQKLHDDFYKTVKPNIATPKMIQDCQQDWLRRRERLKKEFNVEHENHLRRDGAPGHWLN